jgi:hypothetical protein
MGLAGIGNGCVQVTRSVSRSKDMILSSDPSATQYVAPSMLTTPASSLHLA